jgi:adenylate cyclase
MILTRQTERKFSAVCYYVLCWILAAIGISSISTYASEGTFDIGDMLMNLQFALFMGLSHGVYDILILKDEIDCRAVWKSLLIRSLYFVAAICSSKLLCILLFKVKAGEGIMNEEGLGDVIASISDPAVQMQVLVFFLTAYLITFVRSVHKKFGTRVFWNTLLGKSQEPLEEDLVFMMIDLKNSTELAEELGHVKYSSFMKDYYKLLSNCCEENQGEIYQIAGDGAFLTWHTSACRHRARPVECFYDFSVCLERIAPKFIRKYGKAPNFKAAAHCGRVITTEVGNFGSELAYHGDVLNTTSRIQSLCGRLGQEFLISEDLFTELPKPLPHDYLSKKEGFFELKGKKHEILIFSLQRPLTDLN